MERKTHLLAIKRVDRPIQVSTEMPCCCQGQVSGYTDAISQVRNTSNDTTHVLGWHFGPQGCAQARQPFLVASLHERLANDP
jgi:hypothetical protein